MNSNKQFLIYKWETTSKSDLGRLVVVHAGMLSSSQEIVKTEIRGQFSIALEELRTEVLHEMKSTPGRMERPVVA